MRRKLGVLELAVLAARMAVGGVFLFAAVPKLRDPGLFAESIRNYHVVPDAWANVVAYYIPSIELVVAAGLIIGIGARAAAVLSAAMLMGFVGGMVMAMARGINVDCGCFGSATKSNIGWSSIARNLALTIAALGVAIKYRNDTLSTGGPGAPAHSNVDPATQS